MGKRNLSMSTESIIDDFIRHKQLTQSSITRNTSISYSNDLILFLSFLKKKNITSFKKVTENVIEDFYTTDLFNKYERTWKNKSNKITKKISGKRSENSKSRIIASLSSFFKYLIYKNIIDTSPIPKRRSKNQTKSQTLTQDEISTILNYVRSPEFIKNNEIWWTKNGEGKEKSPYPFNKMDKVIIEILYYCGLRVSELIGIKINDLKLNNSNPYMIIYGKGGKLREQPVPVYHNLIDYIENERLLILKDKISDYVFVSPYGRNKNKSLKNLTRQAIDKKIKRICKYSGVNLHKGGKVKYKMISAHMFRHSIGTHLHESGIDIISIRNHLGHSSVLTTGRYIGNFKEKKDILKKYGPFSGAED